MPALGSEFAVVVDESLAVTRAIEVARNESRVRSLTRRELTSRRIDVTYEAAFLRIFAEWEVFLEQVTIRYMCGYYSNLYSPLFVPGVTPSPDLQSAEAALHGGSAFILWHSVRRNMNRVHKFLDNCPVESVSDSASAWLTDVASVRHRIAHRSEDARVEFDTATRNFSGRRFTSSSAGKFLRSFSPSTDRWIVELTNGLKGLAVQIAP
jgi:hypothetical protein